MHTDYRTYYKNNIDAIDTKWHQFTEIQFQWILARLKLKYKPDALFSVMDLGCGTGRLLSLIHETFPNAHLSGIDGTTLMVFRTQNRLPFGAQIKKNDLNTYHLKNRYDVIISTTVLHHINNPGAHIDMIGECLKDDGVAYISEFAIDTPLLKIANFWWSKTTPDHKTTWSTQQFIELLNKTSLSIKDSDNLQPNWFWQLQIYECKKKAA